jgi:hypothetical protein
MSPTEPEQEAPLHPIREGGGFLRAIAMSLLDMVFPRHHRRRPCGPLIDDEVPSIRAEAAKVASQVAPYPMDD